MSVAGFKVRVLVNKRSSFNEGFQQNWESLSSQIQCSILGNMRCTPPFWKHLEDLEVGSTLHL